MLREPRSVLSSSALGKVIFASFPASFELPHGLPPMLSFNHRKNQAAHIAPSLCFDESIVVSTQTEWN